MTDNKDNRQELLRCGLRLFSSRGFDGVSTADIVGAAGVTKPTMYHYFGSKEGLLEEILRSHYGSFIRELEDAASLPEDITLTFFRFAKVCFETARRSPEFFMLRAGLMMRVGQDTAYLAAKPYIDRESAIIRNFFDTAATHAGNIKGKEFLCTLSFLGTINATISSYLQSDDESILSDETIYKLRQQFLYGIYS